MPKFDLMNTLHLKPLGNLLDLNKGIKNIRNENTFTKIQESIA
jgi:hypothetical protein